MLRIFCICYKSLIWNRFLSTLKTALVFNGWFLTELTTRQSLQLTKNHLADSNSLIFAFMFSIVLRLSCCESKMPHSGHLYSNSDAWSKSRRAQAWGQIKKEFLLASSLFSCSLSFSSFFFFSWPIRSLMCFLLNMSPRKLYVVLVRKAFFVLQDFICQIS